MTYDLINAFPSIFDALFQRHGIECVPLQEYCNKRDAVLAGEARYHTAASLKRAVIVTMHFGRSNPVTPFSIRLRKAFYAAFAQLLLRADPECRAIFQQAGAISNAALVAAVGQFYERRILDVAIDTATKQGAILRARLADAFTVEGEVDLAAIHEAILEQTSFRMAFRVEESAASQVTFVTMPPLGPTDHLLVFTDDLLRWSHEYGKLAALIAQGYKVGALLVGHEDLDSAIAHLKKKVDLHVVFDESALYMTEEQTPVLAVSRFYPSAHISIFGRAHNIHPKERWRVRHYDSLAGLAKELATMNDGERYLGNGATQIPQCMYSVRAHDNLRWYQRNISDAWYQPTLLEPAVPEVTVVPRLCMFEGVASTANVQPKAGPDAQPDGAQPEARPHADVKAEVKDNVLHFSVPIADQAKLGMLHEAGAHIVQALELMLKT